MYQENLVGFRGTYQEEAKTTSGFNRIKFGSNWKFVNIENIGAAEVWLSDMHGAQSIPKSRAQRISGIKRQRDTVTKLIEQANLTKIRSEIDFIDHRLNTANRRLTGERANYSSSEE